MWPYPQETPDLITFTEKILHGKLHFVCSVDKRLFIISIGAGIDGSPSSDSKNNGNMFVANGRCTNLFY